MTGAALFEAFPAGGLVSRLLTAVLVMIFIAVVYADLRYLVIPDLYSILAAVSGLALNLTGPASRGPHGILEMLIGAAMCAALLGSVAWVWKKRTNIEGLGLGDVKLAAAIGALLGLQAGVWAITVSAAGGAVLGFILQARARGEDDPLLFPYGALLALAGAGFLLWERYGRRTAAKPVSP